MTTSDKVNGTDGSSSRRLLTIVAVSVLVVVGFLMTTIYAEHRVSGEDARVRRVGHGMTFSDSDLLAFTYGRSDVIGRKLAVSGDRVSITMDGGLTCIVVRSKYLTSTRVSSFAVKGGMLTVAQC